tara:strand:- start:2411 stop:2722 length:312 start_codon:yes stop_codon:yes gene_type:complete
MLQSSILWQVVQTACHIQINDFHPIRHNLGRGFWLDITTDHDVEISVFHSHQLTGHKSGLFYVCSITNQRCAKFAHDLSKVHGHDRSLVSQDKIIHATMKEII